MSQAIKQDFLSPEDYLESERDGEIRHEYVGLEMPVEAVYRRVRRAVGLEMPGNR